LRLNITGIKDSAGTLGPGPDGTFAHLGAQGGTEMMAKKIREVVDPDLLAQFHIIHSRVRDHMIDPNKVNLLVLHDTWDDPENQHLEDARSLNRFAKLIFVSNFQQATFNMGRGVPYSRGIVMQNAIDPIEFTEADKKSDVVRLIYHTTPHRGLELLVPAYEELCKVHDNIHLDVYSSFAAYGWNDRDKPYEHLFDRLRNNPKATYHGFQPNPVVREALKRAHIFAYPCIWPETSCIAVIEAMSARCNVVTSNLHALPETCANFATMYGYEEDPQLHANVFANVLNMAVQEINNESIQSRLRFQKVFFDNYYGWELRKAQWNALLTSLLN